MLKYILITLLVIFIAIQFFRPERNDVNTGTQENTIGKMYTVPQNVSSILKKACNDCHSNYTTYPWYNKIQPVAWWLEHHIQEGKRELNFDEFLSYTPKKQYHKMDKVSEEVEEKHMPLPSYTWMHTDAKLNEEERKILMDWSSQVLQEIHDKTGYVPQPKKN